MELKNKAKSHLGTNNESMFRRLCPFRLLFFTLHRIYDAESCSGLGCAVGMLVGGLAVITEGKNQIKQSISR